MVFSSYLFIIFFFLLLALLGYYATPKKQRHLTMTIYGTSSTAGRTRSSAVYACANKVSASTSNITVRSRLALKRTAALRVWKENRRQFYKSFYALFVFINPGMEINLSIPD